jgi:hypothetical protein
MRGRRIAQSAYHPKGVVREALFGGFLFSPMLSKKIKKLFQIGKKPSYLDFRITP